MPLFFSMEEAVLFLLSLFLVFVLVFSLAIFLPLVGPFSYVLCSCLQHRLSLLTTALLLNVENLLALALLLLLLALASVTSFVYSCCFLVACSGFALLVFCGGRCLIYNTFQILHINPTWMLAFL
jgi:hypothetical protein